AEPGAPHAGWCKLPVRGPRAGRSWGLLLSCNSSLADPLWGCKPTYPQAGGVPAGCLWIIEGRPVTTIRRFPAKFSTYASAGRRRMHLHPVPRDLLARRHPDLGLGGDVVEEARQGHRPRRPAGEPAMDADRHHLRLPGALGVEHVEGVLHRL